MTIRMTWQQLQERKAALPKSEANPIDHMPRVGNGSASTREMWGAPLTVADVNGTGFGSVELTEAEQAALQEFRAECRAVNPMDALKEIDKVFSAWFAEYCNSPADFLFAEKMIAILESALGKTSADEAFDADARANAER